MKHIFVVNPCAGKRDSSADIAAAVGRLNIDSEIYTTRGARDATRFVAERCGAAGGETLRFYACGGDGTLNEVATGVMEAGRSDNVAVGCYPCGSGNDYIKCWPESDFTDLAAQVAAPATAVDLLRVGDRYCVNVMNFGFEAEVCGTMERVRRWPLVGGRMAYVAGIVHCLIHKRHNPCSLTVDGDAWWTGDLLLASAANGRYVGGGFMCAPRAEVDDGWLEALCVNSMSVARFVKLIDHYRKGEHLERVDMHDVVHHRRARKLCFDAEQPFNIVVDGELLNGNHFEAECLHGALPFIVPRAQKTGS